MKEGGSSTSLISLHFNYLTSYPPSNGPSLIRCESCDLTYSKSNIFKILYIFGDKFQERGRRVWRIEKNKERYNKDKRREIKTCLDNNLESLLILDFVYSYHARFRILYFLFFSSYLNL